MGKKHKAPGSPEDSSWAVITDPAGRDRNQDSVFGMYYDYKIGYGGGKSHELKGTLLIVADGMGGGVGGEVASQLTIETLVRSVNDTLFGSSIGPQKHEIQEAIKKAFKEGFQKANEVVSKSRIEEYGGAMMGTTMVASFSLLFYNETGNPYYWVYIGNLGDSRLYTIWPNDKQLEQITEDHSEAWQLYRKGELTKDQIQTYHRKNIITQAIGTGESIEPDFTEREFPDHKATRELGKKKGPKDLTPHLLLCSDGLNDVMLDEMILETIISCSKSKMTLDQTVIEYLKLAMNNRTTDNTTVAICRLDLPVSRGEATRTLDGGRTVSPD